MSVAQIELTWCLPSFWKPFECHQCLIPDHGVAPETHIIATDQVISSCFPLPQSVVNLESSTEQEFRRMEIIFVFFWDFIRICRDLKLELFGRGCYNVLTRLAYNKFINILIIHWDTVLPLLKANLQLACIYPCTDLHPFKGSYLLQTCQ